MRTIRLRALALMLAIVGSVAQPAVAQTPASEQALRDAQAEVARLQQELAAMRDQYDSRLKALEDKLAALAAQATPAEPAPPVVQPPAPAPVELPPAPTPVPGATSSNAKVFNPDIAVIGNFLGAAGHNPNSDQPTFGLDEVETSLQAIVDPYARADVFLAAGPDGLDVERRRARTVAGDLLNAPESSLADTSSLARLSFFDVEPNRNVPPSRSS